MSRRCANSHSSRTGKRRPLLLETCVSASTRVRGLKARVKASTSWVTSAGLAGVRTRWMRRPKRAARTPGDVVGRMVLVPKDNLVTRFHGQAVVNRVVGFAGVADQGDLVGADAEVLSDFLPRRLQQVLKAGPVLEARACISVMVRNIEQGKAGSYNQPSQALVTLTGRTCPHVREF